MDEGLFEWKKEYEMGFKEVDAQHQRIFSIMRELNEVLEARHGEEIIWKTLDDLIQYADYHFAYEEAHFSEYHYAGSEQHISEHDAYRDQIAAFIEESNVRVTNTLPTRVLNFLQQWWIHHITGIDRDYAQCFKEHGLV